jgi:tetratricopeptide (TPR) repeat protein
MTVAPDKFYRVAISVLLLLVLVNAFAAGLRTVADFDMGWHLATGRYVVQHHSIPSTDVLSYTTAGTKWAYPPFAGVLLYLIYNAGGYAGLSWFCALACIATVGFLLRGRDLGSAALAMCAVEPIAFRTGPRADLFNTVFFAIVLGILWDFRRGSNKRLWLLPLTMLIWVNVHPGFILGLAVIGAYVLLEAGDCLFLESRGSALERLRRAWSWLAAAIAITLINPWGPRLYAASLELAGLGGQKQGAFNTSSFIGEFLSVPVSSHLLKQLVDFRHPENGYTWLMLVALLVITLALWRKQFGVAIIQGVALYLSLQHARYIALFCIATVIFGGTLLAEAFATDLPSQEQPEDRSKQQPLLRLPYAVAIVFICALCAVTALHTADFITNRTHVLYHSDSKFGAGEASWFPERAASFIRHERLPGNIFQEFELGGFTAWRLGPEYPDFVDGRADHLAPAILVEQQQLMSQSPDSPAWQAAADKWNINVVLVLESGFRSVARQDALAYCQSSNWRPVYMDEVSLVLLRNSAENRPWLDRLQIDCSTQQLVPPQAAPRKDSYDFFVNAGGLLYSLQRNAESETALLRAAAIYPEDPNARLLLGKLYQRERRFDKARAEYLSSLAREETDEAWFELGRLYMQEGQLPAAEHAFSRAASLSVRPCMPYMALAQTEIWLKRPQPALEAFAEAEKSSPYRHGAETLAPELYAEIASGRSEAHRLLSDLPLAIQFQKEAVRLTPAVASRWQVLAELFESTGQVELSEQARERAQELARNAAH